MKSGRKGARELVQLLLFLAFFALSVALNINCSSDDDNPAADPECGSGRVSWNDKSQVCIDLRDNRVVPNKCCGR